ncbi:MAG: tRNA pseudouridine(13) synthase TruD [Methylophaga sp.]|nr:tRNA pseudouridine(13) synthase TruD [Methylophaga sp.]
MKHFDFNQLQRCSERSSDCKAIIRQSPADFRVTEILPFAPEGTGGHHWLFIEKTDTNTDWLANALARFAGVPQVAVGYAGLKDRHAITRQWFSVNLEGHEVPDWSKFDTEQYRIIEAHRHNKKLKRGALQGNRFDITLRELSGDKDAWLDGLSRIKEQGVPNYFAEQRFGHQSGNLFRADQWFQTGRAPNRRNQRSIILSAGRSWLFNLVLSERIKSGNWNQALQGDVMQLAGSRSFFHHAEVDADIEQRLAQMDIHPTGPLWGRGRVPNSGLSLQLEETLLQDWQDWKQALEKAGLSQERRALRVFPEQMDWQFVDDKCLKLSMQLPAGSYLTAVLRELAQIDDASLIVNTGDNSVEDAE